MSRQNDVYNNESSQRKAALKQKLDGIRNGDSAERVNTGVTLWNFIWNPKVPFIKKIIPIKRNLIYFNIIKIIDNIKNYFYIVFFQT